MSTLSGRVCIVTGASRGIGRGTAIQLASKGAKVYITGRTLDSQANDTGSASLRATAQEIEARGGTCIPVQCDHTNDEDVKRLFEQVARENDGRLDVLVNNAYSGVKAIFSNIGTPFWELGAEMWDDANAVGLRNSYICVVHAARLMVPRKQGLIVNMSSGAGLSFYFNAAYGIGKEACDRMAVDCGLELSKHNVAFVSLWPSTVCTETLTECVDKNINFDDGMKHFVNVSPHMFVKGESAEFSGQCIAAMATDPDLMKMTGKIHMTYDLGKKYRLKDTSGHAPYDYRRVNLALQQSGRTCLANMVPDCIRVPKFMMALSGNKFY